MGTPPPKLAKSRGIEEIPPRTPLTLENRKPQIDSFAQRFGRGIKGKRTTKGSCIHPPPNPKEKGLEIAPTKSPRVGSKNHQKERTGTTHPCLEELHRITIHHKEVHTRSSLSPDHPSLSQDLTMKLSS
jgi:hypothetical protein